MKKVKGLRSTDRWLQKSHREMKYSTGNTVDNTVIIACGARWVRKYQKEHLAKYVIV